MARLLYEIGIQKRSLTKQSLSDELNVEIRTVQRYLKAINENIFTPEKEKLIVAVPKGEHNENHYQLNEDACVNESHEHVVSIFMGSVLMKFLDKTEIWNNLDNVSKSLKGKLSLKEQKYLYNLDKKFYSTSFGMKKYRAYDVQIKKIIKALLRERKLEIFYTSYQSNRKKKHVVCPFTLITHRDSLYLYGYSETVEEDRLFSVDRISDEPVILDKFAYPEEHFPKKVLKGSFGIFIGNDLDGIEVEIEFNESVYDYVCKRQWMHNQKPTTPNNGKFRMKFLVSDLFEVGHWVLGLGKEAKVIKPKELVDWVKEEANNIILKYSKLQYNGVM